MKQSSLFWVVLLIATVAVCGAVADDSRYDKQSLPNGGACLLSFFFLLLFFPFG